MNHSPTHYLFLSTHYPFLIIEQIMVLNRGYLKSCGFDFVVGRTNLNVRFKSCYSFGVFHVSFKTHSTRVI